MSGFMIGYMVFLDGCPVLAFSVDVLTEFLLALPSRESESGDLALVPVSPSPRLPFVRGTEAALVAPRA